MKHLLITVGLGTSGGPESLAGAIVRSIETHNPDVVHFVVTKESDSITLPLVEQMIEEKSFFFREEQDLSY